jgi:predicted dehydrogenase
MEDFPDKLSWGILSAGRMARKFARGVLRSQTGRLAAVAGRSAQRAEEFAREHGINRHYGDYEALLADPVVQAVYVATPNTLHAEWAIRAALAGKHVLCEKPLALNAIQAESIVAAARESGVFLMEAFMYRCHPQTRCLAGLLREGAIGEVGLIRASFGYKGTPAPGSIRFSRGLGGGSIMDVGCYPVSMVRMIAGLAVGREFAEPLELEGMARLGAESGVDEYAVAALRFPGEILAQISSGILLAQDNTVQVFGTLGRIEVLSPWFCSGIEGGSSRIRVFRTGEDTPREIEFNSPDWLYAIEADTVASHLSRGQAPFPSMSWEDSLGNMRALDRWRAAVGLAFEGEHTA